MVDYSADQILDARCATNLTTVCRTGLRVQLCTTSDERCGTCLASLDRTRCETVDGDKEVSLDQILVVTMRASNSVH